MEIAAGQVIYATQKVSLLNSKGYPAKDIVSLVITDRKSVKGNIIDFNPNDTIGTATGNNRKFGGYDYTGVNVTVTVRYDRKGLLYLGAGKFREQTVEYFVKTDAITTDKVLAQKSALQNLKDATQDDEIEKERIRIEKERLDREAKEKADADAKNKPIQVNTPTPEATTATGPSENTIYIIVGVIVVGVSAFFGLRKKPTKK